MSSLDFPPSMRVIEEDRRVIDAVLKGDKDRYALLVEKYKQLVFTTTMGFLHQQEEAEDIAQEVFIKAFTSLAQFQGKSQFSTWLCRITINLCLNKKTSQRPPLEHSLTNALQTPAPRNEEPLAQVERAELHRILETALTSLPPKQRTAFVLSKYDQLAQKEIAAIMEISEGSVEQLLVRAKAHLKEKLAPFFDAKP